MRKRISSMFCVFVMVFVVSGCGTVDDTLSNQKETERLTQKIEKEEEISSEIVSQQSSSQKVVSLEADPTVDVDLTALSSTMVYAEVYNMMVEPESYVGKRIKVRGQYGMYVDEENQQYYHGVIVSDATACCAQGLEFVWNGEHNDTQDYPPIESDIEIIGTYESYEEQGQTWYRIRTDEITQY